MGYIRDVCVYVCECVVLYTEYQNIAYYVIWISSFLNWVFLFLLLLLLPLTFRFFSNFFSSFFLLLFRYFCVFQKKKLKFHFTDQKKVLLRWRGEAGEWVVVCARGRGMGRIKQFCFLNI